MANDSSEVGIDVCFGYVMENGGQNDNNINDRFIWVYGSFFVMVSDPTVNMPVNLLGLHS